MTQELFAGATKVSRFDQGSYLDDLQAAREPAELVLAGNFRAYKRNKADLPLFEKALTSFNASVESFASKDLLKDAWVICANKMVGKSRRRFDTFTSGLKNGFIAFMVGKSHAAVDSKEWPATLADDFVDWLRNDVNHRNSRGEFARGADTCRHYYEYFCSLMEACNENKLLKLQIPLFNHFPINPFSIDGLERKRTKTLGFDTLIKVMNCARDDFLLNREKVVSLERLLGKRVVSPDENRKGMGRYESLESVLWQIHQDYKCSLPRFTIDKNNPDALSIEASNPAMFLAINKWHGGARSVFPYFQPDGECLLPPILLMTVYLLANTEPLRALKIKDINPVEVFGQERLMLRQVFRLDKNRAGALLKSLPVDDENPVSPTGIVSLIKKWTNRIRKDAGLFKGHLFIFQSFFGDVRAFAVSDDIARSHDTVWTQALKNFSKKHGLPDFNLSQLRQTAIDAAREMLNDDARGVSVLTGWLSDWVADFFYKSDAARLRYDGIIANMQSTLERNVRTGGRTDHRGAPEKHDMSAATPGWSCVDPYKSPIAGQSDGKLCTAFGQCPNCPLGGIDTTSAYSFARAIQLHGEIGKARFYLPTIRWSLVYEPVLKNLDKRWLPLFSAEVVREAQFLTLTQLGMLE